MGVIFAFMLGVGALVAIGKATSTQRRSSPEQRAVNYRGHTITVVKEPREKAEPNFGYRFHYFIDDPDGWEIIAGWGSDTQDAIDSAELWIDTQVFGEWPDADS